MGGGNRARIGRLDDYDGDGDDGDSDDGDGDDGDSQKVMLKGLNFDEIGVFFFENNNVLHCNVCRSATP